MEQTYYLWTVFLFSFYEARMTKMLYAVMAAIIRRHVLTSWLLVLASLHVTLAIITLLW